MFEPSVYTARRTFLIKTLAERGIKNGTIIFLGNAASPVNYADNAYMFRQDSCFLYYFGIAEPSAAASIDIAAGTSRLYIDDPSLDDIVWTGPRPGASEYAQLCAADTWAARKAAADDIRKAAAPFLYTPPYQAAAILELAALLGLSPEAARRSFSLDLIRAIVAQRQIKEAREISEMDKAADISAAMHRAVIAAARDGTSEAEIMALALQKAYAGGGMSSFQPIATTRGDILHNHGYPRRLKSGQLFLLDAGAETASGYAGDLTSTFPVSGRYDERQKAVYTGVLRAGSKASAMLRPGVSYKEIHLAAARVIASSLAELGIIKGNIDEAVAEGAHACFFPHGLGHQLGLDVHDMENLGEDNVGYDGEPRSAQFGLKSLRMAKQLQSGMTLTIEPGIYFIEGLIRSWEKNQTCSHFIQYGEALKWIGFGGIRNEEDWLVEADGARKLGKPFDKSIAAMEGYRT